MVRVPKTVEISITPLLPYFVITVQGTELEEISLSDMQSLSNIS